ncbi:MAG: cytochrome c family protein [Rhodoblastus sp.]|nr:MAG: cytochrome c family protein [Rhodoblastus sp.]
MSPKPCSPRRRRKSGLDPSGDRGGGRRRPSGRRRGQKDEPKDAPIAERLAKADAAKGEATFKKNCASCHTIESGGANKVGPNLYGVVTRKIASGSFGYSDGLKGKGGEWTYDNLDHWIANPRAFAAGNKMTFAGDKDAASRADLIAYLRAQAASPAPLP